jgi:DNA-binding transcriptional ArsR family regulator
LKWLKTGLRIIGNASRAANWGPEEFGVSRVAERLSEARRLAILMVLDQCPSREATDSFIAIVLKDLACACSYDAVRSELAWLRDAGLIEIDEISRIMIAKLKHCGVDVAAGVAIIPGVERPAPKQ